MRKTDPVLMGWMLLLMVIAGIYLFPVGWANLWTYRVETVEISEIDSDDSLVRLLTNPEDSQEIKLLVKNLRLSRFLPGSPSKCIRRVLYFKLRGGKTVKVRVDPGRNGLWKSYFQGMKENALRVDGNSYRLPEDVQDLAGIVPSTRLADLTADGKDDTIIGPPEPAPVELLGRVGGFLTVISADGTVLLTEPSGILNIAGIYDVGAKTPMLVVIQWGGGSMGNYYRGYLYDEKAERLNRIEWEGNEFAAGFDLEQGPPGSIVMKHRILRPDGEWQIVSQQWVYRDGTMVSISR